MKDPRPINLTTPDEVRANGWAAEARDADGHLVSVTSTHGLARFIKDESKRGHVVTVFPKDPAPVRAHTGG